MPGGDSGPSDPRRHGQLLSATDSDAVGRRSQTGDRMRAVVRAQRPSPVTAVGGLTASRQGHALRGQSAAASSAGFSRSAVAVKVQRSLYSLHHEQTDSGQLVG